MTTADENLPICGENIALPARFVGCGNQITSWSEVYRCTHCDVAFHKDCANKHFSDDAIITCEMVDEAIKEGYPKC